jgi:hypothetical protein
MSVVIGLQAGAPAGARARTARNTGCDGPAPTGRPMRCPSTPKNAPYRAMPAGPNAPAPTGRPMRCPSTSKNAPHRAGRARRTECTGAHGAPYPMPVNPNDTLRGAAAQTAEGDQPHRAGRARRTEGTDADGAPYATGTPVVIGLQADAPRAGVHSRAGRNARCTLDAPRERRAGGRATTGRGRRVAARPPCENPR